MILDLAAFRSVEVSRKWRHGPLFLRCRTELVACLPFPICSHFWHVGKSIALCGLAAIQAGDTAWPWGYIVAGARARVCSKGDIFSLGLRFLLLFGFVDELAKFGYGGDFRGMQSVLGEIAPRWRLLIEGAVWVTFIDDEHVF